MKFWFFISSALAFKNCILVDSNGVLNLFSSNGVFSSPDLGKTDFQKNDKADIGKPSFSGNDITCFLNQYNNRALLIGVDKNNPQDIHTFSFSSSSWSITKTSGIQNLVDIKGLVFDHDTLVFYGVFQRNMFYLRMEGDPNPPAMAEWVMLNTSPLSEEYLNSNAVVGFGQNHLYYLNLPGSRPGQASVFVIHYAYWQPELQSYNGPAFPTTFGRTANIPLESNSVGIEFAFIPNSFDFVYIVNVDKGTNTTRTLPAPSTRSDSMFTCTFRKLVQLTATNEMFMIDLVGGNSWVNVKSTVLETLGGVNPSNTAGSPSSTPSTSGSSSSSFSDSTNFPKTSTSFALSLIATPLFVILGVLSYTLLD